MKIIRRFLAIILATVPIDIIIGGAALKGITIEEAGMLLFGLLILFVGGLYVWFGAPNEKKLPLGIMVLGITICITSMLALIIGLSLVSTPLCYIGVEKLWNITKK